MAQRPSLVKSSIFYLIYNIFNAVFPFITALYVTRILSSEVIGDVQYALNIATYFALFAFVGIPTYGMREIAKNKENPEELHRLFTELFLINTVTTTISVAAFVGLVFLVPSFNTADHLLIYLVVGIEIVLNYFNISWLFEGLERFGIIAVVNVVSKIVSLVFLILFVKSDGDNVVYALMSVIGISGYYAMLFCLFPKYTRFCFKGLHFKKHFKPILLLVVVNLAIEIYSLVDVTMIGAIMKDSKSYVAYYKYAHQIQKTLLMVINTITLVLVPRLTKLYKDQQIDEYNDLLNKTLTIVVLLSIPMVIGVMFVSDNIVVWLYGDEYIASSIILKILSIAVVISPIGYLLGSRVCLVTDNEKYMPIAVGAGAVVNIGLNIWFINLWGTVGAAIASVVSEAVVLAVYLIFSHKLFNLKIDFKNYIKIAIALIVMTGYLFLIHFVVKNDIWKVVLEILGAMAIYFTLLLVIRETSVMAMFKKVFKRG